MRRALLVGMTSLLLLGAAAGCGSEPGRPARPDATIPPGLTVEQLYASVERAIAGHETDVLHAVIIVEEATLDAGTPVSTPTYFKDYRPEDYAEHIWMQAATDSVRSERRTPSDGETSDRVYREIRQAGRWLSVDDRGNSGEQAASTCAGSDSTLVAVLMSCRQNGSTVSLGQAEYQGKPAILLIARAEEKSDGTTFHSERTTFVDPTTYLPVRVEARSWAGDSSLGMWDYRTASRYDIEFVRRDALADDFFEPATIGYVATAAIPADNLRRDVKGMRVYWIGSDFDAGLPGPLVLQRAVTYPGEFSPGPRATLSYKIAADSTAYRGVGIRQYPIDLGDQTEADVLGEWGASDVIREELSIQGRPAELRRIPDSRYGDVYMIRVYFETTTVVVNDYLGAPPYTGRDAMLRIAAALRPYAE
jgi:hypothetical protein